MSLSHAALWTLDELTAQAALALAVDYPGQASGRVREVPDIRTIRYYTTLGLLDRPAQLRGRTALYGRRHLLQLVAIKRLQAKGLSLAEVQTRVVGQTGAGLRKLAQMPVGDQKTEETDHQQSEESAEDRRGSAFWGASPAPVQEENEARKSSVRNELSMVGVALDVGVTLLLEAARALDEHDREALRAAAAPLLKLLKSRRLIDVQPTTKGDSP
jgi:DNA-binding transcriptional MerR regulator